MKYHLVAAVAGMAIGFGVPALAQEKFGTCTGGSQDACKQIATLIKTYDEAINRKDAAALAAIFAPDAVFVWEGPTVSGREAIENFLGGFIKAGVSGAVVNVDQAHVTGDTAWCIGDWSDMGPGGPNNTLRPYRGMFGDTFVNNGGKWQFRMVVINTIEAPPLEPGAGPPANK
jgi:uncharacterized protein (TIGR02246 family)